MTLTTNQANRVWPVVRDALAFVVGAFILLWETVVSGSPSAALIVTGFACLGVTGAGVAQRALKSILETTTKEGKR